MSGKIFIPQAVLLLLLTACSGNTKTANEQTEEQAMASNEVVVEINETTFPDNAFRSFVQSKDYGTDSKLTKEELNNVKELLLPMRDIQDLTGIEYFTSIVKLNCSMNKLTSLDVSNLSQLATLQCYDNNLTELDLTNNSKLEIAYCDQNKLTSLSIPDTPSLILVSFSENQMKGEALDKLIEELPNASSSEIHYFTICGHDIQKEKNKWTKKQLSNVRAKGWTPYNMKGEEL
jgi:hypothetical protein